MEVGPEADAAATKIQATMRGGAARKIVAELNTEGRLQVLVRPQIRWRGHARQLRRRCTW